MTTDLLRCPFIAKIRKQEPEMSNKMKSASKVWYETNQKFAVIFLIF